MRGIVLVMLIYAMAKARTCRTCGKTDDEVNFEHRRLSCLTCRTQQNQIRVSSTYQAYLGRLYTTSRSSVKTGKRSTVHEFTITAEDLVNLWDKQGGKCALSGTYMTHHRDGSGVKDFNASIDRISNSKDYTPDNVQLVTYRVNLMKHTMTEGMFYWWTKTIHDFSCD
jgi:hypothetical protein